jgi:hypothetical protein
MEHGVINGQQMSLPFWCYDVPENAVFQFGCDDPLLELDNPKMIVREIHNSKLVSKYAYFLLPT